MSKVIFDISMSLDWVHDGREPEAGGTDDGSGTRMFENLGDQHIELEVPN